MSVIYQRAGIVLADHSGIWFYNRTVRRLRALGLDDFIALSQYAGG